MGKTIPIAIDTAALLDTRGRPLHDLRISVVDRCNYRCPYCMPEERYPRDHAFLRRAEILSFEEIERLARVFIGLGVRKIRLTGGEPLLRRELPSLVARLAAIDGLQDLALTTNGSLLDAHAEALRKAGLKRLTISLDSLDAQTFRRLSGGRGDVAEVLAGIAAAERAGFARLKLNCVVLRGVNDHTVIDLLERFRGSGHIVRFIEYMDVGTCNGWNAADVVPSAELRARIAARWPLLALTPSYAGEVASRYAYADGAGEIGFVSSVSAPFCGACSRARLSAEGKLYTCLFAAQGIDLRAPLRAGVDDASISALIDGRWRERGDRYSEVRAGRAEPAAARRVEMYSIGG